MVVTPLSTVLFQLRRSPLALSIIATMFVQIRRAAAEDPVGPPHSTLMHALAWSEKGL